MKNNKKIALFGGSFDPVHTDHLNMAIACYEKLGFDEIWMIPTFLSPFKSLTFTSNKHRLKMLEIITEGFDYIKIDEFEIENNRPTPTIETVKHFKDLFPYYEFSFVIGTDNLDRLEEWNNFYELNELVDFVIFKRNDLYDKELVKKYSFTIHEFNNNNLSSTNVRKLIDINKQDSRINNYINNHLLYLNKRLEPFMDQTRYQHCLNVGEMAQTLAIKNGVNSQQARIAGTLHDITKRWSDEKQKTYLEKYDPTLLKEPQPVWHSFTGAFHLKYEWLLNDELIINAVFNHTVGCENMTTLDKIVFCADKISKERNYKNVEKYREACLQNLDDGFKQLLQMQYDVAKAKTTEMMGEKLVKTAKKYLKGIK